MKKFLFFAMAMALIASSAFAGIITGSPAAPTVNGEDIANLTTDTNKEKSWTDTPAIGQTFTIGSSDMSLSAVTFQINQAKGSQPLKNTSFA